MLKEFDSSCYTMYWHTLISLVCLVRGWLSFYACSAQFLQFLPLLWREVLFSLPVNADKIKILKGMLCYKMFCHFTCLPIINHMGLMISKSNFKLRRTGTNIL